MNKLGTYKTSSQTKWATAGAIVAEEAALGVDERDTATAEALGSTKVVTIKPIGNPYAMLLRFRSDGSEDDDSVLQMYAARGSDHYHRIAQLTVVQGTQDSGAIVRPELCTDPTCQTNFFDTLGTGWKHNPTGILTGTQTDSVARYSCDGTQSANSDMTATDMLTTNSLQYRVKFRVVGCTAGNVVPMCGATEGTDRSADGVYTEDITAATNDNFLIRADSSFVGAVTDISVREYSTNIHFCDTITPASEDALFDGEESDLANMIAHYYVRTLGCDRFLFIASDLDSPMVYIDYALLYE